MNTLELLQIYMHIESKLYNYHRVFASIYFCKIRKVEFALKCLHLFKARYLACWKKQRNYYLLSFGKKIYIAKNEHTLFYETFFRYE